MQKILQNIHQYLSSHAKVSAAWLFGSVAQGTNRGDSDIDIAVLFVPGLSNFERFDLRLLLAGELETLAGRAVDVVDMEAAPLYLQHQVRKTGRLLLEKDHKYRVAVDVRSRREYFDFAPILNLRNKRLIERAIGRNQHG